MIKMKKYYCYAYLREDGSPYYIGKGSGKRIHSTVHNVNLPPIERRVILKNNLTNEDALELEKKIIAKYGRKEFGDILHNKTDGGDSPPVAKKVKKIELKVFKIFGIIYLKKKENVGGKKYQQLKRKQEQIIYQQFLYL